jgi:hypothetical protein
MVMGVAGEVHVGPDPEDDPLVEVVPLGFVVALPAPADPAVDAEDDPGVGPAADPLGAVTPAPPGSPAAPPVAPAGVPVAAPGTVTGALTPGSAGPSDPARAASRSTWSD